MSNLVSPGVSVTVTDESFFIPSAASTVPLIFMATADEKMQPDGITPAAGTFENNVVRTVTSINQSIELYGIPRFLEDSGNVAHHGDARNEYGIFALNQFLGLGNRAFVVRANVNLNDDLADLRALWASKIQEAAFLFENLANVFINDYNTANGYIISTPGTQGYQDLDFGGTIVGTAPVGTTAGTYDFDIEIDGAATQTINVVLAGGEDFDALLTLINSELSNASVPAIAAIVAGNIRITSNSNGATSTVLVAPGPVLDLFGSIASFVAILTAVAGLPSPYKVTIEPAEMNSLAQEATADLFDMFSFVNTEADFFTDVTTNPLLVYSNGFNQPSTSDFFGFDGAVIDAANSGVGSGSVLAGEFSAQEAGDLLIAAADDFQFTQEFQMSTSLGANDAARRVAITTALQATININQEVRSENFEYNLILCPGYPETTDELLALVADIEDEAFVLSDTPMNLDTADVVAWAGTTDRYSSTHVAYYYPHSLASNLDGKNVLAAASGTALRTITFSDSVSELWFAPAGTRRGLVTGVTDVGYAGGQLGSGNAFIETHLNVGQRDSLYQYFTNINPIGFFPGRGILVFGQKTSAPDASALDRINVSRLLKYIKRQLRKNTMAFLFEPNDQLTRDNLKAAVDGFLGDLVVKRGLFDFATICDESNNTPDRIDRNELYIDIAIKPTRSVEFIHMPIRVVATGAEI